MLYLTAHSCRYLNWYGEINSLYSYSRRQLQNAAGQLVVTAIQWLFVFLISFSSIIFYLLAGLFLLVAVLSLIFRVATWPEALRAGLAGFIVFMIPVIGEGITAIIAVFREELSDFIRS